MQVQFRLRSTLDILRRTAVVPLLCLALCLAGCKSEIYQGLSEDQANSMLSLLLKHGIPAEKKSAKAGWTLAVEESKIIQALELMRENSLPHESFQTLGQVFAAQGMISSSTEEKARLSFALSQELSDTCSRIDGVLTARVHVVLASTDMTTGKVTPASAAVFLRHTPDSQATRLIPGIREMAANAVPGLSQDNVSVLLVPVRDTVSVPMSRPSAGEDRDLWIIIGAGVFFLLSVLGLAAAFILRARRKKADAPKSEDAS